MKKLILLFLVGIFCSANVSAQQNDSLKIVKFQVYQNDVKLSKEKLKTLFSNSAAASSEFDKYKSKSTIGYAALLVGAGFGVYLGVLSLSNSQSDINNLNSGKLETSDQKNLIFPAAATIGFISVGAILSLGARDHLIKAVNIYNSGSTASRGSTKLEFGLTANGAMLILKF